MAIGLQDIPMRVPNEWDPAWFTRFVREVLSQADVRNAIAGPGIGISGQSSEFATLSASGDITDLLNQSFVLATASGYLTEERVLTGAGSEITVTDGGPDSTITVGIGTVPATKLGGNIPYSKLAQAAALAVLANPVNSAGPLIQVNGSADGQVMRVRDVGAGVLMLQFSALGANPTAQVGLTAVNGTSVFAMRADAAPPINQAITPTWTGNHNFDANVDLTTISVDEGTNARMGLSTLVGGTVVVPNTAVTANTRIFLTHQNNAGTVGFVTVSARTPATSFTILSSSATDTSNIAWLMIDPT